MDRKYKEAADYYGFHCNGCEDNCCYSRFYHHTLLEYLYIKGGFYTLDKYRKHEIKNKASEVYKKTVQADKRGISARLMCPLNSDGFCTLYEYRPMICRLHGIPHQLKKPGQGVKFGPGCNTFLKLHAEKKYREFDRTPFYLEIAKLENDLRHKAGFGHKLKMTVAQILIS